MYVPFAAPHTLLQEEDKWVAPYEETIGEESRRLYAASITHMDAAIGNIVAALERTGQRDRTLVVFFSDNGGVRELPRKQDYGGKFGPYPVLGDNGPLRGWPGDLYDGCLRTPAVVNWPRVLKPALLEDVVSVLDWRPTLVHLAGGRQSEELQIEGRNIWPLLTGQGHVEPTALYWKRGRAKLEIGLATGKRQHDKRRTEKDRDWERQKARIMKHG